MRKLLAISLLLAFSTPFCAAQISNDNSLSKMILLS